MSSELKKRKMARLKRKKRVRQRVYGTSERPRLTVFRSTRHIYAQVIDDTKGVTIASASTLSRDYKADSESKGKVGVAMQIGKIVARHALEKGIKKVVFDRNGCIYHGRIKALADGAREGGLVF